MAQAIAIFIAATILGFLVLMCALWLVAKTSLRVNPAALQHAATTKDDGAPPYDALKNLAPAPTEGGARTVRNLYAQLLTTGDWRRALERLGERLPSLAEETALITPRSAQQITHDLFHSTIEALEIDFKTPNELREQQSEDGYNVFWIAAYPFLDVVEQRHGGMYETTLAQLNNGKHYVFFQPQRTYFDNFIEKLRTDKRLAPTTVLDQPNGHVMYVPFESALLAVNVAIWNPGRDGMRVMINQGEQIQLDETPDGWKLASRTMMRAVTVPESINRLFLELDAAYQKTFNKGTIQFPGKSYEA